jgi:hypothetical protein
LIVEKPYPVCAAINITDADWSGFTPIPQVS